MSRFVMVQIWCQSDHCSRATEFRIPAHRVEQIKPYLESINDAAGDWGPTAHISTDEHQPEQRTLLWPI